MTFVRGNRDRCGRCGARHGGNDHLCTVHGPVSRGCCDPRCDSQERTTQPGIGAVLRTADKAASQGEPGGPQSEWDWNARHADPDWP